MSEREKGHEWKFLYKFDGLIFSKCECGEPKGTMWTDKKQHAAHLASLEAHPRTYKCVKCCDTGMFAGLPCQLCSVAHPSACQSDASVQQECENLAQTLIQTAAYSDEPGILRLSSYEIVGRGFAAFIRTRLAESRAAMREEAAKMVDDKAHHFYAGAITQLGDEFDELANEIRALPADSSALDARDARVREQALEEAAKLLVCESCEGEKELECPCACGGEMEGCSHNGEIIECPSCEGTGEDLRAIKIRALAQRSAEKGKTEVRYECGCPPRFRVDPKEGKQYEAYCSQHHKPLRRSAETKGGDGK